MADFDREKFSEYMKLPKAQRDSLMTQMLYRGAGIDPTLADSLSTAPAVSTSAATSVGSPDSGPFETPLEESGVGFTTRLGGSFFRGEGEEDYLRGQLKEGETLQRGTMRPDAVVPPGLTDPRGGELFVRGTDGKLRPVDPASFDVGDVADVGGYLPEMIGGGVGAIKGGALGALGLNPVTTAGFASLGGAAGSAAGEAFRQGIAHYLDPDAQQGFDTGEFLTAGLYGAAGEVAPIAIKVAGWAAKHGLSIPGSFFRRGAEGEVAQRTLEAADAAGVERSVLPVSSVTESPLAAGLDVNMQQSPLTRGRFTDRNRALERELKMSLGGTRRRIGGGLTDDPTTAISSGIDRSVVGKAMIVNDREASELLDQTLREAGDAFEAAVGQPLNSIPALTPNLDRLAAESGSTLASQPGASILPDVGPVNQFTTKMNTDTLGDVMQLRKIAGEMMNQNPEAGGRLYAAVMADLDESFRAFAQQAPLGELQASAAASGYKKVLDIARRQYDMFNSPVVQRLFPNGTPNVRELEKVAEAIRAGSVGPEDIRLLKERVGAGMSEGSLTNFSNELAGRTNVALPETSQGAFIWDQIKQLYMDNALYGVARTGGDISGFGQTLYNQMYGNINQASVTRELFGELSGEVENFFQLLRDKNISATFFRNWSNTGPYNEMTNVFKPSAQNVVGALGKFGLAGQFTKAQGSTPGRALLGRQYFQTGDIPDIQAWLHAHRKLAGMTRVLGQTAPRVAGDRFEEE